MDVYLDNLVAQIHDSTPHFSSDSLSYYSSISRSAPKQRHYFQRFIPFVFVILCLIPLLDVCGKLEGESIVGAAIQGIPNVWCFEEPRQSLASQPALSPSNRNSPSPTTTTTRITSEEGMLILDWPIRRMLQSRDDINIRITDKPPRNSSYAAASS